MPSTGKVKWFDPGRGYGFIARDDVEGDVFVHQSAIQGEGYQSLNEDDRVEFDVVQGEKGPAAENVRKLAEEETTEETEAEAEEALEAEAETDVEAEADVEANGDEDPGVGDRAPADVDPKGDGDP